MKGSTTPNRNMISEQTTRSGGPAKQVGMSPFVQPHLAGKNFKVNKREPQKLFTGISPSSMRSLRQSRRDSVATPSSTTPHSATPGSTTPGSRSKRQHKSKASSVNHSIERIQLLKSRSVSSINPSQMSASEYQIKTFAAAIDQNFLKETSQQIMNN